MNEAEKERKAKIGKAFNVKTYVKNEIEAIRAQVGDKKVLLAMSGGVDSSVCAVLLHKAIGKQLTCVFVDHGCMRLNEAKEVKKVFKGKFGINLIQIDAEKRFLDKAKGITDPELKRKCIGGEFIKVFADVARDLKKKLGDIEFLGQGTIYPDIIESGVGGHKAVKAHHNVGGLPKDIIFKGLVEPVKYLYKDEVRPGITGFAQVNGRNGLSWEEKFALDVWYVEHASFLLDLKILFATAAKVAMRKGIDAPGGGDVEEFGI